MNFSHPRATRALCSFARCVALVGALWSGSTLAQAAISAQTVQTTVNGAPFRAAFVQTVYQKLLGRAATSSESAPLVTQLQGGGKAWQDVVTTVAGSSAYFQKVGNSNVPFVNRLFQDMVDRAPDATEEAPAALDFLKGGGSRSELAAVVADTDEFRANWTQIYYKKLLGRAATGAEATSGAAKLNAGGVIALVSFVLSSPEFLQKSGGSQSGWQNAVNQKLLAGSLNATDDGGDGGVGAGDGTGDVNGGGNGGGDVNGGMGNGGMGTGTTNTTPPDYTTTTTGGTGMPMNNSRAPMVQALLASPEYFQGVVQSTYQKFLRRGATPAELQQWGGALQGGGSSDQILMSVLTSDEYFNRAGGTTTGYLNQLSKDLLGKSGGNTGRNGLPSTSDLLDMLHNLPHKNK
ncbi:hypothetical protein IAD21_02541 [Abditibacteriota bacterium]|nr:hypothetical protein IAD21_02541 [Abditibacteriota bacterium]